jgi:hypothetical protein
MQGAAVIATSPTNGAPRDPSAHPAARFSTRPSDAAAASRRAAASSLKRSLGAKDWGSMIEGHGGMMDRLDSMLPAGLVMYLFATLLFPIS